MKLKTTIKIAIDSSMTIGLLLLMSFELIGRMNHEWIGIGMFVLFIAHHILNHNWIRRISSGNYTPYRILQTVLAGLVLITMIGSALSAVILSRHVFSFLQLHGGKELARVVHLLSAYWGFVLMSLHIGLHWGMMMNMAKRIIKTPIRFSAIILRCLTALIVLYGGYAFIHREIGSYLFLRTAFVYFDFSKPLIWFYFDYLAIMGLFVFAGYYLTKKVLRMTLRRSGN